MPSIHDVGAVMKMQAKEMQRLRHKRPRFGRFLTKFKCSVGGRRLGVSTLGKYDKEMETKARQQLTILIHTLDCIKKEEKLLKTNGPGRLVCSMPHCTSMRDILAHISECQEGEKCTQPRCRTTRYCFAHWKSCEMYECSVCKEVHKALDNPEAARELLPPDHDLPARLALIQNAPSTSATAVYQIQAPPPGLVAAMPQPCVTPMTMKMVSPATPPQTQTLYKSNFPQPLAEVSKSWHRDVPANAREELVGRLVRNVVTDVSKLTPDSSEVRDVLTLELEIFRAANSWSEYEMFVGGMMTEENKAPAEDKAHTDLIDTDKQGCSKDL